MLAEPPKLPVAPKLGAVNVTETPATGPLELFTVATSAFENVVLITALCGLPLVNERL